MIDPTLSASLAADSGSVGSLRRAARENTPEGMKAVARQFEALFVNMMMKSMRDATPQDGIFDSSQTRMYTSMLDQELSQHFAKRGIGLADAMLRQMTRNNSAFQTNLQQPNGAQGPAPTSAVSGDEQTARQQALSLLRAYDSNEPGGSKQRQTPAADLLKAPAAASRSGGSQKAHVRAFQERFASSAERASQATGIPAQFMLGQAALESGWGRREIVTAEGTPSYNLFGIKASKGWKGKTVEVATTEYVNGQVQRKMEKFRAYGSYDEAFQDYARLISTAPRYKNVMANAQDINGFAQGLQRAGYATDPNYAAKLTRVIRQSMLA